ncbi:hypothetical protein H072_7751 [Dactylellina haptotyla CBS 200.50]|uniref:G-patch domain-containing protein n=1 Tax=Dactylellina haptotyla (strain CBS 200.50) TaxID=1284197 RepID=S8BGS6_DACHA|nr:hypothetical protein H072_7751 [Dactylellina haptotyla CBS 200.50]
MGLAGPSKKRKISHDPNNTTWTRSVGFGHRMLTAQGWSPGTILGPDPNNPYHTAASQTGIKVMLKDDNLGLGCKGSQEDTCTGLGDLQSLLSRLNGKTEESVRSEEDTRRKMWIEGRYGMRFVKGEVLESTWVTNGLKKRAEKGGSDTDMGGASEREGKSTDDDDEDDDDDEEDDDDDTSENEKEKIDKSKKKKKKDRSRKEKDKKKKKRKSSSSDSENDEESSGSEKDTKSEKAKRKADKAARKAERAVKKERKEAKRLRKDEKRRAKAEKKAMKSIIAGSLLSSTASTPPTLPSTTTDSTLKSSKKTKSLPNSLPTSGSSTPITGRQALRSKWIAQKRMAVMDAKALNEILMIKAA